MLVRTLIRGGKVATNLKKVTSTNLSNSYIFLSSFSNKKFFSTLSLTESSTQFSKIGKNSLSDGDTYLNQEDYYVDGKKVFMEVYGCQMNHNDAEIANSILVSSGYKIVDNINNSDVVLLMTCSIREGAEQKIWRRLDFLSGIKRSRVKRGQHGPQIGILGCMAERLKMKILQDNKDVDLICGPDSYRSLPRLLHDSSNGQAAANVLLSLDETYADIQPIRRSLNSPCAYVSIMRGCNNMCTYCVVPFTRGRERSRQLESIVEETRRLVDQGVKEITLLGQNVNSYHDNSASEHFHSLSATDRAGFKTVYKSKSHKSGVYRFVDLLDHVSRVDGEVRVRFTSPHPKDFPDEMLQLIAERSNVCKHIHIPAQSGSDGVLERMGRGYQKSLYLQVVQAIRHSLPGVSLSSDFIAGFCGESEEDHQQTLSLMEEVKYNMAFCFPYSMREKTRAYHRLQDDVPRDVKLRRAQELVDVFRSGADLLNKALIGSVQLVLVEGFSKRSEAFVTGRSDGNTKVVLPRHFTPPPSHHLSSPPSHHLSPLPSHHSFHSLGDETFHDDNFPSSGDGSSSSGTEIKSGDYVAVKITSATSQVLHGTPLHLTSLSSFHATNHRLDTPSFSQAIY